MGSCVLCLEAITDKVHCISSDSDKWQELNITNVLEKHFWPLSTIQLNSLLCSPCLQSVDDFHKFYLRIEAAHMKLAIKVEKEDANYFCSDADRNVGFVVNVKNEPLGLSEDLDSTSNASFILSTKESTGNSNAENRTISIAYQPRKRKHSKEERFELGGKTDDCKTIKKVKKKSEFINENSSENTSDIDADNNDAISHSETCSSEIDQEQHKLDAPNLEESSKSLYCCVCTKPFLNLQSLRSHKLSHLEEDKNESSCSNCNKLKMMTKVMKFDMETFEIVVSGLSSKIDILTGNFQALSDELKDVKTCMEAGIKDGRNQNHILLKEIRKNTTALKNHLKKSFPKHMKTFPLTSVEQLEALESSIDDSNETEYIASVRAICGERGAKKGIIELINPDVLDKFNLEGNAQ